MRAHFERTKPTETVKTIAMRAPTPAGARCDVQKKMTVESPLGGKGRQARGWGCEVEERTHPGASRHPSRERICYEGLLPKA